MQVPEAQQNPARYFHPKDPAGVTLCSRPPSWPSLCLTPQLPAHCAPATGFSSQLLKNTEFSPPRAFTRAVSSLCLDTLYPAYSRRKPPRPSESSLQRPSLSSMLISPSPPLPSPIYPVITFATFCNDSLYLFTFGTDVVVSVSLIEWMLREVGLCLVGHHMTLLAKTVTVIHKELDKYLLNNNNNKKE